MGSMARLSQARLDARAPQWRRRAPPLALRAARAVRAATRALRRHLSRIQLLAPITQAGCHHWRGPDAGWCGAGPPDGAPLRRAVWGDLPGSLGPRCRAE